MFFKLHSGTYVVGGKTYIGGDIIESALHLDLLFINKFTKVHREDALPVTPAAFAAAHTSPPAAVAAAVATGAAAVLPPAPPAPTAPPASPHGVGATHEFSGAADAGLVVYKQGTKYNIAMASAPDVLVSEGPLTKKATLEFINELAEG